MAIVQVPLSDTQLAAPSGVTAVDPREVASIADELARAFRGRIEYYKDALQLSEDEAISKAGKPVDNAQVKSIMGAPADEVSWHHLHDLAERDPALALERWGSVKSAALDELRSGNRAAKAVEGYNCEPIDRARYLAIREDMASDWQPRSGIETSLIDQMALAYHQFLYWMEVSTQRAMLECREPTKAEAKWEAPRVTEAEAREAAATMADRCHRIFMRSLRALRDLRRYSITIQNVGQMNVGGQQVNVMPDSKS